jgi:hypothetical protein
MKIRTSSSPLALFTCQRDGVDGARTGIWLKREPCQDGCR